MGKGERRFDVGLSPQIFYVSLSYNLVVNALPLKAPAVAHRHLSCFQDTEIVLVL